MIQRNTCHSKDISPFKLELVQFKQRFLTELESLERRINSQICYQADRITELESYVAPYSNDGEAICNFRE